MKNAHQLKAYFNFLKRQKLFTAINIFGFAVSLMFVILLGIYIQDELRVDSQQANKDRVYRLEHEKGPMWGALVAEDLSSRYPEIERTVRTYATRQVPIVAAENEVALADVMMVDSTFFSVFSYPYIAGNEYSAMKTREEVVLTESFARKLFGRADVVGEVLKTKDLGEFMISAVMADFTRTHLRNPDVIMSFQLLPKYTGWDEVISHNQASMFGLYLQLRPGTELDSKLAQIEEHFVNDPANGMFYEKHTKDVRLLSLKQAYFTSGAPDYMRVADIKRIRISVVTALLILIFAVINYINLSVAQTGFRAKEAATRRLLGGTKGQLIFRLLTESVTLCAISLMLGLLFARIAQPLFQKWFSTSITVAGGLTGMNILFALGGVLLLGLICGIIPGLSLSAFKPLDVVKGDFNRKTKMVYSKVLISFQYCITIALIGCTIVMTRQVNYMTTSDMGFNRDLIIAASIPPTESGNTDGFRDELLRIPGVEKVTFPMGLPIGQNSNYSFTDIHGNNHMFSRYYGDSVFFDIFGFEVIHRTGYEGADGVWLNETGWNRMGFTEGDIETKTADPKFPWKVRGVVKDFHTTNFHEPIGEVLIGSFQGWQKSNHTVIKVSAADPFGTMDRIKSVYEKWGGGSQFDGEFLDRRLARMYSYQKTTSHILMTLSGLAIIISALGMLAMSTYFLRQRSKEVAVRKVFGAKISEVMVMLMMTFMKLVLIAFVVSIPIIWYFSREWLMEYAYRISLSWTFFAMAGFIAVLFAGTTILWQSWKAATANPVLAVRD